MPDKKDVQTTPTSEIADTAVHQEKVRNPFRPKLGEYSNDPADLEKERIAARAQVKKEVGDYILSLDAVYPLWSAERKDGKPVPRRLQGKWKSPGLFRQRVEALG